MYIAESDGQFVKIPKKFLEALQFQLGDQFTVKVDNGNLILTKVSAETAKVIKRSNNDPTRSGREL